MRNMLMSKHNDSPTTVRYATVGARVSKQMSHNLAQRFVTKQKLGKMRALSFTPHIRPTLSPLFIYETDTTVRWVATKFHPTVPIVQYILSSFYRSAGQKDRYNLQNTVGDRVFETQGKYGRR